MDNKDIVFFRNFSVTVGALAFLMVVFLAAARTVADSSKPEADDPVAVEQRTAPVGRLVTEREEAEVTAETTVAGAAPGAAAGAGGAQGSDGAGIYSGVCVSCHGSGIPGIPQVGDAAAWSERVAKGKDALYANAINGYTGTSGIPMPAKGGNPALSDAEVQAAVDYMVENSQ